MPIMAKQSTPIVAQLDAKAVTLIDATNVALSDAIYYTSAATEASAKAELLRSQATAVAKALRILEEAGVTV
jgi:hypothetical protein